MSPLRSLAWLVAYAVIAPLSWLVRSRARAVAFLALAVLASILFISRSGHPHDLRLATFNIREYGVPPTDDRRLAKLLAGLDADVIAVQEIQAPARFAALVGGLRVPGRRYAFVPSRCGGRLGMHVGFVYDAARVKLAGTPREFPELDPEAEDEGACGDGDRPGCSRTSPWVVIVSRCWWCTSRRRPRVLPSAAINGSAPSRSPNSIERAPGRRSGSSAT